MNFKLSVRVLSASVPALAAPGVLTRQRPRLEVTLGDTQKDTELADWASDNPSAKVGACARECPWRFGDTLTFLVRSPTDLVGPGLRLRLRAQSDLRLGPVELQIASIADLGETVVDLRRRVLPACVRSTTDGVWESPALLFPLVHVRGGLLPTDGELGKPSAHVALAFSVTADPEQALAAVHEATMEFSERVEKLENNIWQWMSEPVDLGWIDRALGVTGDYSEVGPPPLNPHTAGSSSSDEPMAAYMTHMPARRDDAPVSPDLDPEGWVSRRVGNRVFWHHVSLGPAPWDLSPVKAPSSSASKVDLTSHHTSL